MGRDDGGDASIARASCSSNDTSKHGGHQRQLHTFLRFQSASEVALGQVRQFVREYRGVFGFSLGMEKQSAIDAYDPTRCGKGV